MAWTPTVSPGVSPRGSEAGSCGSAHAIDDVQAVIERIRLVAEASALGLADANDLHLSVVLAQPVVDFLDERSDFAARAEVLDLVQHADILLRLHATIGVPTVAHVPARPA